MLQLDEMATASDVERKEIGRTYRFVIRKLGIKVNQSSPKDYISRFSSVLKLPPTTPQSEEVPAETVEAGEKCSTSTECQQVLGKKIIELAAEIKQQRGIDDASVKADTGASSFECLVLQVAYTESRIRHCQGPYENNNPLYCENNKAEILGGDEGASLGIMQINENVHGEKLNFEENVNFGINLLINNHASSSKEYVCNGKTYSGWTRALRGYNGWNTDCSKGNIRYVEDVIGFKDDIYSLFPECGS